MNVLAIAALAAAVQIPVPAALMMELRGGVSVGEVTAAHSGRGWQPGVAWSGDVGWYVHPAVAVFVGYGSSSFGCNRGLCTEESVTFTSRGPRAGVRYDQGPFWVRGAYTWNELSVERLDTNGENPLAWEDSGRGGAELAAGVMIDRARFSVTPGVRYTVHGAAEGSVGVLAAELGVRIR